MKATGLIMILVGLALGVGFIVTVIFADYHYSRDVYSNWELSIKASTIAQKSEYVDKFVDSLKDSGLQGSSAALFLKTPDNSCDENFKALVILQDRLHNVQNLDQNSFAYQTAIQQITAQEQDEADEMLLVIRKCWFRTHYYPLWNPILLMLWLLLTPVMIAFGLGLRKVLPLE